MFKILLVAALLATCAQADVLYTMPAGHDTVTGGSGGTQETVSGWVDFFLSGCSTTGTGCALNIEIANTTAATQNIHTSITGLTFSLSGISTSFYTSNAALRQNVTGNIGGYNINEVTSSTGTQSQTQSIGNWKTGVTTALTSTGTNWGPGGPNQGVFALETSIGGTPVAAKDEIVNGDATGFGSGNRPEYEGPVYFQITGLGLTTSTQVTNISLLFGQVGSTGVPDGYFEFPSGGGDCQNLGGTQNTGSCLNGTIGSMPEPTTPLLAGSALLVLAFVMRRRHLAAN